jgi:hypothetical protein
MWEVPPSAVLALRPFSLKSFTAFLRPYADIQLVYLGLDILLPQSLGFIFQYSPCCSWAG